MKLKNIMVLILAIILIVSLSGCTNSTSTENNTDSQTAEINTISEPDVANAPTDGTSGQLPANGQGQGMMPSEGTAVSNQYSLVSNLDTGIITEDQFSSRDLEQTADLSVATTLNLTSGNDTTITTEGVYIIKGNVTNASIIVDAGDTDKVQLVLDGVTITNDSKAAIYVKSADKVFVTTTGSASALTVNGTIETDGDTNVDAVIFSKADLTLNGTSSLNVVAKQDNAITSKDDLKVTGGTYNLTSVGHGLEAKDSIRVYDGLLTINAGKDALHGENEEDATFGYIYIQNGTINITSSDDAIHSNTIVQIDGGTINIENASEGIEATFVKINGGDIKLYATDDGINAANKSDNDVRIEVNGGIITVTMASGDTDGFDSNGDLYINGGSINVTANSAFDADGARVLNGGTVIVNGQQVTEITVQQMGGPGGKRH
ncbi:carbohydrate-binding domain-containing protein [Fusibacter bizertensis]|uniref:Carbohydrate-binding domain-containing protein n=1 Tax=Fusibacter bizertensis TaxID=1488331 RepID=A0ABT6NG48_9FIRM|nr:carbohydrate-binding domain-containing protein [Fusibacter bizertensis]MDH8679367.1 carbohydrate-binding domain-containing protein [Fusibacter bizertensis]